LKTKREDRDLPDWPEWCYCPLAGAYAVVSGGGSNTCDANTIENVARNIKDMAVLIFLKFLDFEQNPYSQTAS